jgi:hypothetical protein
MSQTVADLLVGVLGVKHEIKIRDHDRTIVFTADPEDGRLVIRQVPDGKKLEGCL